MHRYTFMDLEEWKLKLGRVIAEGGQAQIYEASWDEHVGEVVAKVFKMEGFSLAEFRLQLPRGGSEYYQKKYDDCDDDVDGLGRLIFKYQLNYCSSIHGATILDDGRFAFVMSRKWGDLRTLINLRLKNNSQGPPFSPQDFRVQDLVERCWEKDPSKRPQFKAILGELKNIRYGG